MLAFSEAVPLCTAASPGASELDTTEINDCIPGFLSVFWAWVFIVWIALQSSKYRKKSFCLNEGRRLNSKSFQAASEADWNYLGFLCILQSAVSRLCTRSSCDSMFWCCSWGRPWSWDAHLSSVCSGCVCMLCVPLESPELWHQVLKGCVIQPPSLGCYVLYCHLWYVLWYPLESYQSLW